MSTSRRKRKLTRQQQSETTRQALLDVSLELFIRRGYAGTTVRDIAKKAGISVGLMFHYFSSKQALLEAHIETVERGLDSVAAILNSSETSIDTFRQIADLILGSFQEPYGRNLFLLANQVLSLDSIPNAVKRRVSATKSLQASVPVIMRGQARGEIRSGDPLALAVAFWGALQGVAEVLVWNPKAPIPKAEHIISILARH